MKDYWTEVNESRRKEARRSMINRFAISVTAALLGGVLGAAIGNAATITNPGDYIVSQNEKLVFDVTDSKNLNMTFQALSQDWSYSAGGVVQVFDGTTQDCDWCGITVGSWQLSKWVQEVSLNWSWPALTEYQIRVYGTHGDSHLHYVNVGPVDAPAPVPLPASAYLIATGFGALALVKRRRVSKFFDEIAQQRGAGEGKSGWV